MKTAPSPWVGKGAAGLTSEPLLPVAQTRTVAPGATGVAPVFCTVYVRRTNAFDITVRECYYCSGRIVVGGSPGFNQRPPSFSLAIYSLHQGYQYC